jgi:hypothetical protein
MAIYMKMRYKETPLNKIMAIYMNMGYKETPLYNLT